MTAESLVWARSGDGFTAKAEHGTWFLEPDRDEWILAFQANFTRGMLIKGRFPSLHAAQSAASR